MVVDRHRSGWRRLVCGFGCGHEALPTAVDPAKAFRAYNVERELSIVTEVIAESDVDDDDERFAHTFSATMTLPQKRQRASIMRNERERVRSKAQRREDEAAERWLAAAGDSASTRNRCLLFAAQMKRSDFNDWRTPVGGHSRAERLLVVRVLIHV
jgi:hypothetical protein